MAQFTTETAAVMARKSWEARRLRAQAEEQSAPVPQPATDTMAPEVSRVRAKLDKLDALMDDAEDDRQWDSLSRAYERMFRVWCTLTKTPGPGNLKPATVRQRASMPTVEPLNCGPNTPTGSVPPAS